MRRIESRTLACIFGLIACKPEAILVEETGLPLDTGTPEQTYFVPVIWQVSEVMFLWDSGAFQDFHYEAGGSPASSFMTLRFMTQDYLETGSSTERCDWTTELDLREETTRGDPSIWTGMQIEPSTIETDCTDFDPEIWEGGNPIEHLESASLWMGLGPSQALGAVVETLYEQTGQNWPTDGEPYVFSLFFGLWDGASLGLMPSEVNYAVAYDTNVDGAIRYDSEGNALLEEVDDGMPTGVIRAFPYHSSPMSELPP